MPVLLKLFDQTQRLPRTCIPKLLKILQQIRVILKNEKDGKTHQNQKSQGRNEFSTTLGFKTSSQENFVQNKKLLLPQNVVDSLKPLSEVLINDIHHTRYLLSQTSSTPQHSSIQNHLAYHEKLLFELYNTILPYHPSNATNSLLLEIVPLLIQASESIRAQIWNPTSGPHLLIMLLSNSEFSVNIKVLSALITWLQLDTKPISKYL